MKSCANPGWSVWQDRTNRGGWKLCPSSMSAASAYGSSGGGSCTRRTIVPNLACTFAFSARKFPPATALLRTLPGRAPILHAARKQQEENSCGSEHYFLPAASVLRVGSAPCQVTSAVGP